MPAIWRRFTIGFGFALIGLAAFIVVEPVWLGITVALVIMIAGDRLSVWDFERRASLDEKKADLEDRKDQD